MVTWTWLEGGGGSPGTPVLFRVQPHGDGCTAIHFTHRSWSHTGGNNATCETLWGGRPHRLQD